MIQMKQEFSGLAGIKGLKEIATEAHRRQLLARYHEEAERDGNTADKKERALIKEQLAKLSEVGAELRAYNGLKLEVKIAQKYFDVNDARYFYAKGSSSYLQRMLEIYEEKPFSRMVPLERVRVYGQMNTCLKFLKPCMKGMSDEELLALMDSGFRVELSLAEQVPSE